MTAAREQAGSAVAAVGGQQFERAIVNEVAGNPPVALVSRRPSAIGIRSRARS